MNARRHGGRVLLPRKVGLLPEPGSSGIRILLEIGPSCLVFCPGPTSCILLPPSLILRRSQHIFHSAKHFCLILGRLALQLFLSGPPLLFCLLPLAVLRPSALDEGVSVIVPSTFGSIAEKLVRGMGLEDSEQVSLCSRT
jgi:hypothetical protein